MAAAKNTDPQPTPEAAAVAAATLPDTAAPDAFSATLTKDGHTITTSLPREAVQLRAAGWVDVEKKGSRR